MNLHDDRVENRFHKEFFEGTAYPRLGSTEQQSCGNKDQARACAIYGISGLGPIDPSVVHND